LFGYDYDILYKKGKENVVVDAISRKYKVDRSLFSLSFIVIGWLQEVFQEWLQDPKLSKLIQTLQHDPQDFPGYSWHHGKLHYKGLLYLRKQLNLKSTMISKFHASPTIGHSGFTETYE
jgi:hypothetical protein